MKENQRIKVTKKMLKDSLLQLLKEKNLEDITVTELCARAQINRTTFYRYYKLPADVLSEMEQELVLDMVETINNIKTVADAKGYLKELCERCHDKTGMLGYLLRYESDTGHAEIFRDLYKTNGGINGTSDDTEYNKIVATYFAGGSYFILRLWAEGGINRTSEEMASLLWELMTGDYSVIAKSLK